MCVGLPRHSFKSTVHSTCSRIVPLVCMFDGRRCLPISSAFIVGREIASKHEQPVLSSISYEAMLEMTVLHLFRHLKALGA